MAGPVWKIPLFVIDVLEDLGVPYHVGGSFASSIHGIPWQRSQTCSIELWQAEAHARSGIFAARPSQRKGKELRLNT